MTLIEISIGLLILGLMTAAVVPSVRSITGAELRATAGQLAGAVRYMYGRSALTGQTCRLVFEMPRTAGALEEGDEPSGGAWWAECTESKLRLGKDLEDEDEEERPDEDMTEEERSRAALLKKAAFSGYASSEVPRTELDGLAFDSIWVAHRRERQTSGKAYLYFFPMGFTEDAIIAISDGDTIYSVQVRGLSGRVKVVKGRPEPPNS